MIGRKYILITVALCIGCFIVGARLGAEAFVYSDAKYKAAMAVSKLKRLNEGDLENLKDDLDFELDKNMYWHGKGQSSILRFLWPELLDKENKVIKVSAKYRNDNPDYYFESETGEFEGMVEIVREIVVQHGK